MNICLKCNMILFLLHWWTVCARWGVRKTKMERSTDSLYMTRYTFLNTNQICRFITSPGGKQYAKNETRYTSETEGSFSDQARLAEKICFRNSRNLDNSSSKNHHSFPRNLISFLYSPENIKRPILLFISICKWKTIFVFWSHSWKCSNIAPESLLIFPTNLFRIRLNF